MSFHDLLNGLLSELEIPYFEGSPEFEGEWPELFVTYSVDDGPAHWGCGQEFCTRYNVTFSIYSTGENMAQNAEDTGTALDTILTGNGFTRISGSFGFGSDFPDYYRRIVEYCCIISK